MNLCRSDLLRDARHVGDAQVAGVAARFTSDDGRATRVGWQQEFGMVGIDMGTIFAAMPFAGTETSGSGREESSYA